MSRLCPTAATACSVARSFGRVILRAGRPAAIAPLVTTTTRCPAFRASTTSPHSFSTAARSMVPSLPVIEDVPTFTTTIDMSVVLILEGEATNVDDVSFRSARLRERLVDAKTLEPVLDESQRLCRGDVVQGNSARRRPSEHDP